MSNLRICSCHVTNIFSMSIGFMSHVDFEKWPCHPVEFKGQGPLEDDNGVKLIHISPRSGGHSWILHL